MGSRETTMTEHPSSKKLVEQLYAALVTLRRSYLDTFGCYPLPHHPAHGPMLDTDAAVRAYQDFRPDHESRQRWLVILPIITDDIKEQFAPPVSLLERNEADGG